MDVFPIVVSLVLTLAWASVGKLSSGESFKIKKFAETLGVQFTALVVFYLAGYLSGVDLAVLASTLPTLIAAYVMKAYSWYQKKKAGLI